MVYGTTGGQSAQYEMNVRSPLESRKRTCCSRPRAIYPIAPRTCNELRKDVPAPAGNGGCPPPMLPTTLWTIIVIMVAAGHGKSEWHIKAPDTACWTVTADSVRRSGTSDKPIRSHGHRRGIV
jgi:hypothetical protein